jgi:hypothetical protein
LWPFFESDVVEETDPAAELGKIFQESIDSCGNSYLCQTCKRELGLLNIIGFGQ